MKKFYIVLLFFSVALTLSAQEERSSLLSENRRWTICSWTSPSQSGTKLYYEYVLRGDTTINERVSIYCCAYLGYKQVSFSNLTTVKMDPLNLFLGLANDLNRLDCRY